MLTADAIIVQLLDANRVIGQATAFTRAHIARRHNGSGSWELVAPLNDALGEWLNRDWPGISFFSPETGWRVAASVRQASVDYTRLGATLIASGPDWVGDLGRRTVWPQFNLQLGGWVDSSTYQTTGMAPEQAVWEWLSQIVEGGNYGPDGFQRQLPISATLEPFAGTTSASANVKVDGVGFLDRAAEVLEGTDFGIFLDVRRTDTNVLAPRFSVAERPTPTRSFSVADGSIERIRLVRTAAETSRMIGLGNNGTEVAESSVASTGWQTGYAEDVTQLGSLTGGDLTTETARRLAVAGPVESLIGENPVSALYGSDLDVGWNARIVVPDFDGARNNREIETIVVGDRLEIDAANDEGWRRTVQFGRAERSGYYGLMRTLAEERLRRQRLERSV